MSKTTHQCLVVEIPELKKHPDADSLSVCEINGYPLVLRTEDWQGVKKAVHIPPENLVDVRRPEFSFLKKKEGRNYECVRVIKLRGQTSAGCLIPMPDDAIVGHDMAKELGVIHDDPEAKFETFSDQVKNPTGHLAYLSKYDIDAYHKMLKEFKEGELIWISAKKHGSSSRYVFSENEQKMFYGSRNQWRVKESLYGYPCVKYPQIEEFCKDNPGWVVYGEVFGMQGGQYNYGLPNGAKDWQCFDILKPDNTYVDFDEFLEICEKYNIPTVNILGVIPFDIDVIREFAEGPDPYCETTIREGCVVKPVYERKTQKGARAVFKVIGSGYNPKGVAKEKAKRLDNKLQCIMSHISGYLSESNSCEDHLLDENTHEAYYAGVKDGYREMAKAIERIIKGQD